MPAWDAVFGSGGRAAAAISALSPGSTLHTYAGDSDGEAVEFLKAFDIAINVRQRPTPIVFVYFHPLSQPHIQPPRGKIERQPKIRVAGDVVLRFGFLEGDAIVEARRAVYDPQSWRNPVRFDENGSVAEELAIVLNELELLSATGLSDLDLAASCLMERQGAVVIVAKGGIRGATVFERDGTITHVPAYRSFRVFKIGTGDVFSATFTHYWAEKDLSAVQAADAASRSVAAYCNGGLLPVDEGELPHLDPLGIVASGTVLIEGCANTLGQRYTMEEARFVLRELGVSASSKALDNLIETKETAILVLAEGLDMQTVESIQRAKIAGLPIVILRENGVRIPGDMADGDNVVVTNDFSSALYFAAWAASEPAT